MHLHPANSTQVALACALWIMVTGCALAQPPAPAEASLQALKRDLAKHQIQTIRVLFFPYELETVMSLTPEDLLEKAFNDDVREMTETMRVNLIKAIDATKLASPATMREVRWGGIFRDVAGKELHAIYLTPELLHGGERRVVIDGNLAEVNDTLVRWFEETFRDLMNGRPVVH